MKNIFDFLLALFLFILFSPLLLLLSILVAIFLGRPVFFKQPRLGYQEKIFVLYKFRTMTDKKDAHGVLLADAVRLTRFGKFLRASSLDELPQLLNILKGDMSFVGPRPLLVEYLPLYNSEQRWRHQVRPGITGWAQINGRNSISWVDKFRLDCWYVEHHSLRLDLKILGLTFLRVLRRNGINQQGQASVEKFNGQN